MYNFSLSLKRQVGDELMVKDEQTMTSDEDTT